MNMTQSQMEALQAIVEAGAEVATVAYNPNTVTGDPEADALADGWSEYLREDTANLVEVIYTR
jgi:hypothetical protein